MNVMKTDVLIVGGGGAGLRAAVEARSLGSEVLIVSKQFIGFGDTRISHGGTAAAFGHADPADNPDQHFRDTVEGGDFLNDQQLVRILASEACSAVTGLERLGCIYGRTSPDKYETTLSGGHRYRRSISFRLGSGMEIVNALKDAVLKYNIDFMENTMITRLLTYDGKVVGATGFDMLHGDFCAFRAKSVILAAGGVGGLFHPHTTNFPTNTGDGLSMAYRVCAELVDMEFIQCVPYGYTHPEAAAARTIGEPNVAGPYGRLYNALGERIMLKYDPEFKELSTRARVACAIAREVEEGRGSKYGGCLLDLSENKKHSDGIKFFERYKKFDEEKYDELKAFYGIKAAEWEEPLDVYPVQHYIMGGVKASGWCETCVPGLYAAGQMMGGVHGSNRLGANSLTELIVFGRRAGISAANRAIRISLPPIDTKQVDEEHKRIYEILEHKPSEAVSATVLKKRVQKIIWDRVGVVRGKDKLVWLIEEIGKLRSQLPNIQLTSTQSRYNYEWIEYLELPNILDVGEMMARSALMRTESRGAHYRVDYPERNDAKWLRNIVVKLEAGEMRLTTVETRLTELKP